MRAKTLLLSVLLLVGAAACAPPQPPAPPAHPDLSGFWALDVSIPRDEELMSKVAPDTVFMNDTGPKEFPAGEYGGLKPRPIALEAIKTFDPHTPLSPEHACKAPTIVYAMQVPFPIEIFQSERFIVIKMEYYDLVRLIFLDGRKAESDYPDSPVGFSSGHWEGDTLVVETTHLEPATITNNGLNHSKDMRVLERFRLSPDGKNLLSTQEYDDPTMLENRGVRFIGWHKDPGKHAFPYECDPTFAGDYQPPAPKKVAAKPAQPQQQSQTPQPQ